MFKKSESIYVTYQAFEPKKEFVEICYNTFRKEPIMENGLLLLSKNYESGIENAKEIIEKLKGANIKIFVKEYFKKEFADIDYVEIVETGSDEFYRAAAVCRYIYAENKLFPTFLKRDGQIVFNNVVKLPNMSNVKSRINYSVLINKSDYFLSNLFRPKDMDIDGFVNYVKSGRTDTIERKKNSKKELLLAVNLEAVNAETLLDTALRFCQNADFSKYDITLLFAGIYIDQYSDILKLFPKQVSFAAKYTFILGDEETNKCVTFLCQKWLSLRDSQIKLIKKNLPKNFFNNECNRILGKDSYDILVNLGYFSFYWDNIFKILSKKRYFVDENQSENQNIDYLKLRHNFMRNYSGSYILNKRLLDWYLEIESKVQPKIQLLPISKHKKIEYKAIETQEIGGIKYQIFNVVKDKKFDFFKLDFSHYFEGTKDYIIIDNGLSDDEAMKLIEIVIQKNPDIIIFDFYRVLTSAQKKIIATKGIDLITSYNTYFCLFSKLGTCFLKKGGRQTDIFIKELQTAGKEVKLI